MTINEIKELAQKLKDADVERIKAEIKSKESILKNNDLDEEELGEVLNTLFSILVIEQAFEDEVEGVEDIRAELEQELMESYEKYDKHMAKYKKEKKEEKKKKKKRWLLDFFALSEDIRNKKETLGDSKKLINKMQNQINELKQQASDSNLERACDHRRGGPHRDEMGRKCNECGESLKNDRGERDHISRQRDVDGRREENNSKPSRESEMERMARVLEADLSATNGYTVPAGESTNTIDKYKEYIKDDTIIRSETTSTTTASEHIESESIEKTKTNSR